jgi:hypothetical protein
VRRTRIISEVKKNGIIFKFVRSGLARDGQLEKSSYVFKLSSSWDYSVGISPQGHDNDTRVEGRVELPFTHVVALGTMHLSFQHGTHRHDDVLGGLSSSSSDLRHDGPTT